MSAVLLGAGLGLALGAGYMAAGMGQAAVDHTRSQRLAQAVQGQFSDAVLEYQVAGEPAVAQASETRPFFPSLKLRGFQSGDAAQLAQPVAARRDLDCLTQAVYFEARGESARGQQAVAQVVLNRVKAKNFPKTVCGVVYQGAAAHRGCQFSFACDGSMRRGRESAAWNDARRVAARALSGVVLADVGGATHFHTTGVNPGWGPQMLRVAQVGLHVFYKTGPYRGGAPVARATYVSLPASEAPATASLHLVSSVSEAVPAEAPKTAAAPVAAEDQPTAAASADKTGKDAVAISAAKPAAKASDTAAS